MAGSEKKKWLAPPNFARRRGKPAHETGARGARVGDGVVLGVGVVVGVAVSAGVGVFVAEGVTVTLAVAIVVALGEGVGGAVGVRAVAVRVNRSATCDATGSLVGAALWQAASAEQAASAPARVTARQMRVR